jgi:hypothetical protein
MALVMTEPGIKPALVPLPLMTREHVKTLVDLIRGATGEAGDHSVRKLKDLLKHFPPLEDLILPRTTDAHGFHHSTRGPRPAPMVAAGSNYIFRCVLAILWKAVVEPVIRVGFLKLEVRLFQLRGTFIRRSLDHLWWCPTETLISLPIYVAGIYAIDGAIECVSDYAISSYIPKLNTLLASPPGADYPLVLFKRTAIYSLTRDELRKVKLYVPEKYLVKLGDDTPALVDDVVSHLHAASIVHFACHGKQGTAGLWLLSYDSGWVDREYASSS